MASVGPSAPQPMTMAQPMLVQAAPMPAGGGAVRNPTDVESYLGNGLLMKQRTSQCCRCCCCQPNIHWEYKALTEEIETLQGSGGAGAKYASMEEIMITLEDAPYTGRCCSHCMPGYRETKYTVHAESAEGPVLMTHSKGKTCGVSIWIWEGDGGPVRIPLCCNLPNLVTKDAHGNKVGESQYLCDGCLFVPKWLVKDANGRPQYYVRSDTCFFGACVVCKCGGRKAKCCRVPFYIRDPVTKQKIDAVHGKAMITDLWAGWVHECCTHKDLFAVQFPRDATAAQKQTLMGTAHLIDLTWYEQDGQ